MNLDIFYENMLHYLLFVSALLFCHIFILRSYFSADSKYETKILRTTIVFGMLYGLFSLSALYFINVNLKKSVESKLLGYAPSYAITFEKMGYEKINEETDVQDKTYLDLIDLQKRWLEKNPYISDIYTMKRSADGIVRIIVDSETDYDRDGEFKGDREQRTQIGEVFNKDLPELTSAFNGQAVFVSKPYADRWGEWLSAFVPIKSSLGQVVGVLGVDYEASLFSTEVNKALYSFFGFFIVLYIILVKIWTSRFEAYKYSEELKSALLLAQDAEASKSRFLSYMSHEIRTPLNGIVAISNSLADQPGVFVPHVQFINC